jgi:hypothetical protein
MINQTSKNQPPLSYWQRLEAEKLVENKKRRNVILSRRSGEIGDTAYATSRSSFAGGEVESRSRVSLVGNSATKETGRIGFGGAKIKTGFAQKIPKSGFAKGGDIPTNDNSASKPPVRPLGFNR